MPPQEVTVAQHLPDTFCPSSPEDWRDWLEKHHKFTQSIWLVYYRVSSSNFNLSWSDAVDEALCFGWIDSTKKTIDEERFMQLFSKRNPKSTWSRINKDKVEQLIAKNRMTPAGMACIEVAKQNGNWTMMDAVEQLIIPDDLEKAFQQHEGSKAFFLILSKSARKGILYWIVTAKREATREKRITEVASLAAKGRKPKQFN